MINQSYLLPEYQNEPQFYNDILQIEKIPIFNDLKNNFHIIKHELVSNFNYIDKIENGDFLYSSLGDYVISKNDHKTVEKLISAYSLDVDFFIEKIFKNYTEDEMINIIINIKKMDSFDYNLIITGQIDKIKNLNEKSKADVSEQEKENFLHMLKLNRNCLFTNNLLKPWKEKKILTTSYVSRLKPNCYIKPHNDPIGHETLRVHYGLSASSNCWLKVGDECKEWQENNFLIFNANGFHKHSIEHNGENDRIILIMDIKKKYLIDFKK